MAPTVLAPARSRRIQGTPLRESDFRHSILKRDRPTPARVFCSRTTTSYTSRLRIGSHGRHRHDIVDDYQTRHAAIRSPGSIDQRRAESLVATRRLPLLRPGHVLHWGRRLRIAAKLARSRHRADRRHRERHLPMALLAVFEIPYNMVTVMLPPILITLSVCDVIHVINGFHEERTSSWARRPSSRPSKACGRPAPGRPRSRSSASSRSSRRPCSRSGSWASSRRLASSSPGS